MKNIKFLKSYFKELNNLLNFSNDELEKLSLVSKILVNTNKIKKKLLFLETVVVQLSQVILA